MVFDGRPKKERGERGVRFFVSLLGLGVRFVRTLFFCLRRFRLQADAF